MSLIGELRSSVDYYATLTGRSPVRRVVVTGGGSRLVGFIEQLQQQLRLPVVAGSTLDRIDCSRLKLPPEEITRLDSAVAVVVGLALPGPKGVKELDLLPPEVVAGRKRKRIERAFILVGIVLVLAMVGLGVQRFLKVHTAENQVASLAGADRGSQDTDSQIQQRRTGALGYLGPCSYQQSHRQNRGLLARRIHCPGEIDAQRRHGNFLLRQRTFRSPLRTLSRQVRLRRHRFRRRMSRPLRS